MWRRRSLPGGSPRKPQNLITCGHKAVANDLDVAFRGTDGTEQTRGETLDGRVERDGRDVVQAVGLAQREQMLGFGREGVHERLGHRLAPVDAVVVAERPDRRAPRGVGGPHRRGERGVELIRYAAYLGDGGVPGLRLPEPVLRLAGGFEKLRAAGSKRHVGLVLLLR